MRTNLKTIKLAKVRRLLRIVGRRYKGIRELEYPFYIHKEKELIEETAEKIYEIIEDGKNND